MLRTAKPIYTTFRAGLSAGLLAVALSACGSSNWGFPYKANVQQGNWITSEQVAQLRPGMTREQVRYVLGTPTLQDPFRQDRWDYPFVNKPGYGEAQQRKFTVWFEGDSLTRWEGDDQPDRQPFERADTGMSNSAERPAPGASSATEQAVPAPESPDATPALPQDGTPNPTGSDADAPAHSPPVINAAPSSRTAPGVPTPGRDATEPLR